MPARSPRARSSAWPSAIPTSSVVWWAPVSRSPLASTVSPSLPWRASSSSMWSRKPTPLDTAISPPSRSSESLTSVSPVLRSISAVRAMSGSILPRAGLGRLAVDGKSLGAGKRADRRGERFRRRRRDRDDGGSPQERPGAERAAESSRAPGRQYVVRTRGVVAERRRSVRAHEHAPGDAPFGAGSVRELELEVLGGESVGESQRLVVPRRGDDRDPGVRNARSLRRELGEQRAEAVEQGGLGGDRDQQAVRSVLRLGAQVERHLARVGGPVAD